MAGILSVFLLRKSDLAEQIETGVAIARTSPVFVDYAENKRNPL